MGLHPFYSLCAWWLFAIVGLALVGAGVIGLAIGRRRRNMRPDLTEFGTIQTSVLGLLALLLGFTFGVSFARYDTRRQYAIDEANALGTTFLRAQALPQPYRSRLTEMLREYIDLRCRTVEPGNERAIGRARRLTEHIQQRIWAQAAALGRQYPTPVTASFFTSLNESIDLFASRVATYYARVPASILWILTAIALAALTLVGYGTGLSDQRTLGLMILVAVMVAAVIVMIVDLDQPMSGPTRVSQQSMIDLRDSLSGFEVNSQ